MQHFLTHAIDHFTFDELTTFQYLIISGKVCNGSRCTNVTKASNFYPTVEIIEAYAEYQDKKILEKMYTELMTPDKNDTTRWQDNVVFGIIIKPLMNHFNVMIVCDKEENDYIDALCTYLKKEFHIEVIDLNQLFTKGRVGEIYLDRKDIHNRSVDIGRNVEREMQKQHELTSSGRSFLLEKMTDKERRKKLKSLGIDASDLSKKDMYDILMTEWVEDQGD
jgi:hypothetical protein